MYLWPTDRNEGWKEGWVTNYDVCNPAFVVFKVINVK